MDLADAAFPQAYWEHQHVPAGRVALRTGSSPLVFDAVPAGMGVALLATASADTDPALVRVDNRTVDFGLGLCVLTSSKPK